jgi:nucleoside-diphosphate-sugar epimerase
MRILVTGATGFVGRAIVAELQKENHEVFCLGSLNSINKDNLPNFQKADIADFESLKKLENLQNIEAVIHSAGLAHQFTKIDEEDFWRINVVGTKNSALLAANSGVKHFILISSVAVYGKIRQQKGLVAVREDFECEPESVYARSKLESEKAAREVCEKKRIPLTILRLATVIGENDRGNTARLIETIDKRLFIWIGKGKNYKSLVYKNDVAKACLSVLDKKTPATEIFNVTAKPVSMKEIVSEIALRLDRKIPKIHIPVRLLQKIFLINTKLFRIEKILGQSATIEKWLSDDIFSGDKIASEYGFRAETPISEAIRRQVEVYKNRKNQKNRK